MSHEPVDVLVIGAGASGAAVAWSLAETRMKVLCLEQGGHMGPEDYPAGGLDWEIRGMADFSVNPNIRCGPSDYPINDSESPISPANFNAVGGSTILFAGHFPRMRPNDFRVRSQDGVAEDWPLDYATLEPFFAENDRIMGVSGLAGDPSYPPKTPPLPPLALGPLGRRIAAGFEKLDWQWWPSDSAIASRDYEGRAACINLGNCLIGCAQGAKASTDITYWPAAQRLGVELRTGCRVREVTLRPDGLADGVLYYDEAGVLQEQKAEIVILACNGIGTPRLLLASASNAFPDGLANRSGLVGRNLMFHPYGMVTGVFDEPFGGGHFGPVGCALWSHEFYDSDASRGFVRGYSFEATRTFGPVTTALFGAAHGKLPWGAEHHAAYQTLFDRTASLMAICEDLPEEHNRVTLDPELSDSHGIPAPKIQYTLGENSLRMLEHGVARGSEVLEAAGAHEVFVESPLRMAGWHMMGTARMGHDPERSVVNEWGRCHDVRNLFIVDGSIFVTSSGVNPTSTIQALALYIADRIKRNLDRLFD